MADNVFTATRAELQARIAELEKAQTKADVYDMLRDDYGLREKGVGLADFVDWQAKRIAELESRTVKLPEPYAYLRENDGQIQISIGAERPSDRSGGYATPWFAIYTAAGIKVEAE